MLFLRRLSRFIHLGARVAVTLLVASLSARADNLAPELSAPLPALTLAPGASAAPIPLADHFRDPDVPGSAVRITTRIGADSRVMDLSLYDAQAPKTVANFLAYVDSGRYAANFFHRSVPGFIIQTGGFYFVNDTTFDVVPAYPAVVNEPGLSNIRSTIAMAKLGGDPNSATNQWFINLADNSANLDAQNGGFTVFGRVLGDGMAVADAIAALPRYNVSQLASAWTDLPLSVGALARGNFIETSAARIAPLSFTVASDNPELVTAAVTEGVLTLTASAEQGGDTVIHLTATDLEGGTFVSTFPVRVFSPRLSLSNLEQTYNGSPRVPTAITEPAGLPVSFLYGDPGTATPPTAAGSYPVAASITDPASSATITFHSTLVITRAPQTITLAPLPAELPLNAPAFPLVATTSSGLPVAFTVEGPATLGADGLTLTLGGEPGLVRIRADQPGDANHEPAQPIERTLTVLKLPQTLAFPELPERTYDPASPLVLPATSDAGLPITYTVVEGPAHLAADGVTLVITGAGEITVAATQPGTATVAAAESVSRTLTVTRASQTLTFTELPPALIDKLTLRDAYPDVHFPIAATASSGLPVLISLTADVTPSVTGDLFNSSTVALAQATVPAARSRLVTGASLIVDGLIIIGATGPVTDRGELTFYRRVEGTVTLTATQVGDDNHLPAEPITFTVDVGRAQTITFAQPAARAFGPDAPASTRTLVLSATASSRLPVTFEIVSGPATLAEDQRTLTLHDSGTVVLRARQAGDAAYLPAPPVTRTLLVKGSAQTLAFTAPSASTFTYGDEPIALAATTTAPGGVTAFPITFTVVEGPATLGADGRTLSLTGAGSVVILANQAGGAGFGPASLTRTLTVGKMLLGVRALSAARLVGLANEPFTLAYTTGFVNGDTAADLAPATLPVARTSATAKSSQGDYPITVSGGRDANYVFIPSIPGGVLHVLGFGGTYEALLEDGASIPVGKLTVTVPTNALTYTGTLSLAREAKAVVVSSASKAPGTTILIASEDFAHASATWTRNSPGMDALSLDFTVSADGSLAGSLTRNGQHFANLSHGRLLYAPPARTPIPWAGQHTLALHSAFVASTENEGPFPRGSGVATALVSPTNGTLTLAGFLADGAKLTANLKPWITRTEGGALDQVGYVAWINPHAKRTESFLAGHLALQPQPETDRFPAGRRHIPADGGLLTWKKAESAKDKSYRAGFGPLSVSVALDPWLPPTAAKPARGSTPAVEAVSLPRRLGLVDNNTASAALTLSHGPEDLDLGAAKSALPSAATLTAGFAPAAATLLTLPVTTPPNPTGWKILSFAPATGAFTGSFRIQDPAPAKARTVAFTGTLRQAPADEEGALIGTGFFLVPGAAPSAEQPSGEIRFSTPVAAP